MVAASPRVYFLQQLLSLDDRYASLKLFFITQQKNDLARRASRRALVLSMGSSPRRRYSRYGVCQFGSSVTPFCSSSTGKASSSMAEGASGAANGTSGSTEGASGWAEASSGSGASSILMDG
jgi:hypothetical protein